MGLSAGGLIRGGAYMRVRKKASETTDIIRECIVLFVYLLIKENLYPKSYLSGPKIGINDFIREGLCVGEGLSGEEGLYVE